MAEVVGFLRDDATHGEKQTLKFLQQNLPKEYTIYVETPIHKKRDLRYPDFIVLTNYGVIVLEVKDWVTVERADPQGAIIRTRAGTTRHESNPVNTARDFALILSRELNTKRHSEGFGVAVPWSYAAVLINLPPAVITQLRRPWGEEFVLGRKDLENSDLLLHRLRNTFPPERMRALTRQELDLVRATVYPVVEIEVEGRPSFVLDPQQEKIVAEPIRQDDEQPSRKALREDAKNRQETLFEQIKAGEEADVLPEQGERLVRNISIRLVRGFSGSGKTLVLIQRAKFLAAQYPEWKIGVLTYNKPLQEELRAAFQGTNITPQTFHAVCRRLAHTAGDREVSLDDWLKGNGRKFDVAKILAGKTIKNEVNWLRDLGITTREEYLKIERRGVGKEMRLKIDQRNLLFDLYEAYRSHLREEGFWDWGEVPIIALTGIEKGVITPERYDALLIDEAQDWAPVWFKIINHLIDPEHGLLFLSDDPSQSIYRYFSWREKGVHVVGRTRWLRVPYRNTYEIYQAAYHLIDGYTEIQQALFEDGEKIEPELSSDEMRHGQRPLVRKCLGIADEIKTIKTTIDALRIQGFRPDQIAVLCRFKRDMDPIIEALKGTDVNVHPIHSFKGLEREVILIPHLQKAFTQNEPEFEAMERRLWYMAMSRARSQLILSYAGRLPPVFEGLRVKHLADFLE